MSRQFDAKHHILKVHPEPCEDAKVLFLDYLNVSEADFVYEEGMTPLEYIYGKDAVRCAEDRP